MRCGALGSGSGEAHIVDNRERPDIASRTLVERVGMQAYSGICLAPRINCVGILVLKLHATQRRDSPGQIGNIMKQKEVACSYRPCDWVIFADLCALCTKTGGTGWKRNVSLSSLLLMMM